MFAPHNICRYYIYIKYLYGYGIIYDDGRVYLSCDRQKWTAVYYCSNRVGYGSVGRGAELLTKMQVKENTHVYIIQLYILLVPRASHRGHL